MNLVTTKFVAYAAAAALLSGAGGYYWARSVHKPALVEVSRTACGLPLATTSLKVPLETTLAVSGNLGFGLGPLEVPDGGGVISLRFDPAIDGGNREVRLVDDVLHLPTGFGRDKQSPTRISISCRNGAIASVRYQGNRRASTSFSVVREQTAAMAPEQPEPIGTTTIRTRVTD